ncbi:1-phosphofructokinase family hexose kinase [Demetria terragena]|uniref:1-phosphofructokinase family hexose kinase n=1 Tax=Demetria terragena TaxID=63959 RepID=UPI000475C954|nr:hexose kinase [Demetria terragena]
MIITLTPNPAIDMTYTVPGVRVGETHAVEKSWSRAGGKGVNTASVLTAMDIDCVALCPTGEEDLTLMATDLDSRGIKHLLVPVPGRVRRSVAAVEPDGTATVFNEPGTRWPSDALIGHVDDVVHAQTVVAVCGSVPIGTESAVLDIIRQVQSRGAGLVLDLRDEVLQQALELQPDLVKPNRSEAAATLGLDPLDPPPAADLAMRLIEAGAQNAAVSDGRRGVTLATREGALWSARLPDPLPGNATGAGDALTAALAAHLQQSPTDWPEALRMGVAYSAAAVLQPVAGEVDPADVARLSPLVELREVTR